MSGIGRTPDNPIPAGQGGVMLGNSLIRAQLRGDSHGVAVTVLSLLNQNGPGNNAAAASTLSALAVTAAASLADRFGIDGALHYLDGLDVSAQADAIAHGAQGREK